MSVYHVKLLLTHFYYSVFDSKVLLFFWFSLTPMFDPPLFTLIPLSTYTGVSKNFILCLFSLLYTLSRWSHLYFAFTATLLQFQKCYFSPDLFLPKIQTFIFNDMTTGHVSSFLITFSASSLSKFQSILYTYDNDLHVTDRFKSVQWFTTAFSIKTKTKTLKSLIQYGEVINV